MSVIVETSIAVVVALLRIAVIFGARMLAAAVAGIKSHS